MPKVARRLVMRRFVRHRGGDVTESPPPDRAFARPVAAGLARRRLPERGTECRAGGRGWDRAGGDRFQPRYPAGIVGQLHPVPRTRRAGPQGQQGQPGRAAARHPRGRPRGDRRLRGDCAGRSGEERTLPADHDGRRKRRDAAGGLRQKTHRARKSAAQGLDRAGRDLRAALVLCGAGAAAAAAGERHGLAVERPRHVCAQSPRPRIVAARAGGGPADARAPGRARPDGVAAGARGGEAFRGRRCAGCVRADGRPPAGAAGVWGTLGAALAGSGALCGFGRLRGRSVAYDLGLPRLFDPGLQRQ